MNIAICRLIGLALGPQLPPLDVKSVIIVTDGIMYSNHAVYAVSVVCVAGGTAWAALQMLPAVPRLFRHQPQASLVGRLRICMAWHASFGSTHPNS